MSDTIDIALTDSPILADPLAKRVIVPATGASVLFLGTVREEHHGRAVDRLDYKAYEPMALREMQKIGEAIVERWQAKRVVIHHRLGTLQIGEASIGIALYPEHAGNIATLQRAADAAMYAAKECGGNRACFAP